MRIAICASLVAVSESANGGPIQKVIQLLGNLQSKVIAQGEEEAASFEQFSSFCEKQSTEKTYSIGDLHETITEQKAVIDNSQSNLETLDAKINEVSSKISSLEKDLARAKSVRGDEHQDFLSRDADLAKTVGMLTKARDVIEKKLSASRQGESSLVTVASSMKAVVDSTFVALENKGVVAALLQDTQDGDDSGDAQPILKTFENLKDKAIGSRNEAQQEEMKKEGAYKLFAQATTNEKTANEQMLEAAKKAKNKNLEALADAQAELEAAQKDLAADQKTLSDLQHDCMEKATEFENAQRERAAELKTLGDARKILSGPAETENANSMIEEKTDDETFVQLRSWSSDDMYQRQLAAASLLKKAGDSLHSWVLSQVGEHVRSDPFGKVKRMIEEMVQKLIAEQQEEASHKAWCDKEIAETTKSINHRSDKLDDVSTFVDQQQALSEKLQDKITALLTEISQLDQSTREATQMRDKEHRGFDKAAKELSEGQQACAMAIKVLGEYYGQGSFAQTRSSTGGFLQAMQQAAAPVGNTGSAASSIIGLLEVTESDFSKGLAEATAEEDAAQKEYEELMQDSKVERAVKETDIKNKKAEKLRVDNLVSEGKVDMAEAQKDLQAAEQYMDKLKSSCANAAPSFEERQARRKKEMESLENALSILDGKGVALLQH
mmetsp:Transcript_49159/g.107148  ORF Transcript_49159/g.107148 Transcript_49159/m.107148 type:complete len:667 (-) Transcript_49159:36-2036(-)